MQGFNFASNPPARVKGGIANETTYTMKNIASIMKAANSTMDDLLECVVILSDLKDFDAFNKIYATFFTTSHELLPTRVASEGVLFGGAAVEIKCTGEVH